MTKEASKIRKIVKKFDHLTPYNATDALEELGLTLTYLGSGSYRKVYRINNLPLVVKFAHEDEGDMEDSIDHSSNEMSAIETVKTDPKYKKLRKYLPKVYFFHKPSGTILMHEYPRTGISTNKKKCAKAANEITHTFEKAFDLYKNFSVDKKGNPILLDWGILGMESEWGQYDPDDVIDELDI